MIEPIPKKKKFNRLKPRAKEAPTKDERLHMDRIAKMGCLVCGAQANIHHVMGKGGCILNSRKLRRRDHRFVAPLCQEHHQTGKDSVHDMGSERLFKEVHEIDLIKWSHEEWNKSSNIFGWYVAEWDR